MLELAHTTSWEPVIKFSEILWATNVGCLKSAVAAFTSQHYKSPPHLHLTSVQAHHYRIAKEADASQVITEMNGRVEILVHAAKERY